MKAFLLPRLAAAVLMVTAGAAEPDFPAAQDLARMRKEGAQLQEQLQKAVKTGGPQNLAGPLKKLQESYGGDPAPVLESLLPVLHAEDLNLRLGVAGAFLKAGFHRGEAVAALLEVMKTDRLVSPVSEEGPDAQLRAARLLVRYRAEEAADGLWEYYEGCRSPMMLSFLVSYLAELGDSRPLAVAKAAMADPGKVLAYAEVLGRFIVPEAREPLEKALAAKEADHSILESDKYAAEYALYQITGDRTHLQYLLDHAEDRLCFRMLLKIRAPEVNALLEKQIHDPNGQIAEKAFINLQIYDPGNGVVKQIVSDYLTLKNPSPGITSTVVLQVGANLRDPGIDAQGRAFDNQNREGRWLKAWYRRDWPLVDLGMQL